MVLFPRCHHFLFSHYPLNRTRVKCPAFASLTLPLIALIPKKLTSPHEVSMPTTANRTKDVCFTSFQVFSLKTCTKEEEGGGSGDGIRLNGC